MRLIISDVCRGLAEAAAEVFPKTDWQRCVVVHFYRNVFSHVLNGKVTEVARMLKAIHAQEDRRAAGAKAREVVERLKSLELKAAAELLTLVFGCPAWTSRRRVGAHVMAERFGRHGISRERGAKATPKARSAPDFCRLGDLDDIARIPLPEAATIDDTRQPADLAPGMSSGVFKTCLTTCKVPSTGAAEPMSRDQESGARSNGTLVAERAPTDSEGWRGMEQLDFQFSAQSMEASASDTALLLTINDKNVPAAWAYDCSLQIGVDVHFNGCSVTVSVPTLAPLCRPFYGGTIVDAIQHGAAKQVLTERSVVHIAAFRDAKLRQARLSFFDKVLKHAESLPQ